MAEEDEFAVINKLLNKLKAETESCIVQVARLEKEMKGSNILKEPTVPVKREEVFELIKAIHYESGDTMRVCITKLEAYILENDLLNYDSLLVVPNKVIGAAFKIEEGKELSYESLLQRIPELFK